MKVYPSVGIPPWQSGLIKAWTDGVDFPKNAMEQLKNVARMPFVHKHVAVMPDVHLGMGCSIGTVLPTIGAVIPAAVGVDIGCGMMAVNTGLRADQLPDNLVALRTAIESAVPHGRTDNGGRNDRGAWHNPPAEVQFRWRLGLNSRLDLLLAKHKKLKGNSLSHLGTLGTGNHFIEICLDERDAVWVMLHSGSRGIGNAIGRYFIEKAKEDMRKWFINLPDQDLAYLPEGTEGFDDYVEAVGWAQDFAKANRQVMMRATLAAMRDVGLPVEPDDVGRAVIQCHHNYIARENHYGKNVWVTRKGAVRAREGDLGIIPGSMGARSFIVRGLGNSESFHSCSHGAGRVMSRSEARRRLTLDDHARDTRDVECRKDQGVLDESPKAYKDIEAVMSAQRDLVEVVHELKQVVCVKG